MLLAFAVRRARHTACRVRGIAREAREKRFCERHRIGDRAGEFLFVGLHDETVAYYGRLDRSYTLYTILPRHSCATHPAGSAEIPMAATQKALSETRSVNA